MPVQTARSSSSGPTALIHRKLSANDCCRPSLEPPDEFLQARTRPPSSTDDHLADGRERLLDLERMNERGRADLLGSPARFRTVICVCPRGAPQSGDGKVRRWVLDVEVGVFPSGWTPLCWQGGPSGRFAMGPSMEDSERVRRRPQDIQARGDASVKATLRWIPNATTCRSTGRVNAV